MSDPKPHDDDMDLVARSMRAAPGNVPRAVKDAVARWWSDNSQGQGFARAVCARLEVTHAELFGNPEVPRKQEGRIVFETDVTRDMCNYLGAMHGGCTSFLIDICTSIVLNLIAANSSPELAKHVSLALNITFHAPAVLGARLRIINTSVAFGTRVMTVRSEVFDVTNGRIVATGVHMKMPPSQPKL
ncbi:PaaI family thioesterase [Phanerochaete sordida]|uniref:PaaI family thioesterase n=1 Tax=Phanerochaete sordida TaxID=48140 RepID=A0A9P3G3F4_9APHY|nr:PaaI family thioesterase [Phanerochaete sordida]